MQAGPPGRRRARPAHTGVSVASISVASISVASISVASISVASIGTASIGTASIGTAGISSSGVSFLGVGAAGGSSGGQGVSVAPSAGEALDAIDQEAGGGSRGRGSARPFVAGEKVLLIDSKGRRYLLTLQPGQQFHTHAGVVDHDGLLGLEEASTVRSSHGARYLAVRPTLAEVVLEMPRGAQVIYPKDLGPLLIMADIFPGARVLEAGLGSGALSMALLRAGADVTG